ncbi:glycosyl hydrolase family 28 protein [Companilactobacillus sp. HBUAS56257]|uniref:glycosyl hydrolase family 28 protein n=1 Tax=Companilactobacillus sp. HBUAS56257 TaxID=3109360 RepID=UPI002FF0B74A
MKINLLDYLNQNDPVQKQTQQFQQAINDCQKQNGGTIIIPQGTYQIGSILLCDNLTLNFQSGAVIKASTNLADYIDYKKDIPVKFLKNEYFASLWNLPKYYFHALISAYDCQNITIKAEPGAVLNGQNLTDPNGEEGFRGPMGIVFANVKNLTLSGYNFINSANWSHAIINCQNVYLSDITILGGHDGFNLHHSTDIKIKNCHFETGDDCLAGYDINNLLVENCHFNTACNATRLSGKNILIKDCTLIGPGNFPHLSTDTNYTHSLLKYYSLKIDNNFHPESDLKFSNLLVSNSDRFIVYQNNNLELLQDGTPLKEISFENINFKNLQKTSTCFGNNHKTILNLNNCHFENSKTQPLLLIDDQVEINIFNTFFAQETVIQTTQGQRFSFIGLTNWHRQIFQENK